MDKKMRSKIDFGIDLGTTNSAIAVFQDSSSKILKSKARQKDTMASCVSFRNQNSLGSLSVGDKALDSYRSSLETKEPKLHKGLIEFKRDMGTDKLYSLGPDEKISPEKLSSLVLMELKKNILDEEDPTSIVITVPNAFKNNQIDATRKAGELAGFSQVEILHEPVAAAMFAAAEGLNEDGYKLIFDFGGGTFDAAIIKLDQGIFSVIDSEGDPRLGGKDLDAAVIEEILLPKFINDEVGAPFEEICNDKVSIALLKRRLKPVAEELRISLSTETEAEIDQDEFCEDDDGDPFDFFVELTRDELSDTLSPIYQKAVDRCLVLMERCHLVPSDLEAVVLVGGPTLSPICRELISSQLIPPYTAIDPMTSIAKGAAIYASQRPISESILRDIYQSSDGELKLTISCAPSTVEEEELVSVKIDSEACVAEGSFKVNLIKEDWESDGVAIEDSGSLIMVPLAKNVNNIFTVVVTNQEGKVMKAYPKTISISHGTMLESSLLGWAWGIEALEGKHKNFVPLKGLEKNTPVPASGMVYSLEVLSDIRPGAKEDIIKVPLYQGDSEASGTRAIYQEHVYDAIITGEDIIKLIPAGTKVDLTLHVDSSQKGSLEFYIPIDDFTHEWPVPENHRQSINKTIIKGLLEEAKNQLNVVNSSEHTQNNPMISEIEGTIESISFRNIDDLETDELFKVQEEAKSVLKKLDSLIEENEWEGIRSTIITDLDELKLKSEEKSNQEGIEMYENFLEILDNFEKEKNVVKGRKLIEDIYQAFWLVNKEEIVINSLHYYNNRFNFLGWKDKATARILVTEAVSLIGEADVDTLVSQRRKIIKLLEKKSSDNITNILRRK